MACRSSSYFKTNRSSNSISAALTNQDQVDSLIKPYKTNLDAEMNEVLVVSAEEFPKERGKPETKLGNLVADLSLTVANKLYKPSDKESIDFCLLNFGGLRTSLPKGEITRGKIFELMPFENELVVVTISKENYYSFLKYIYQSGGQPISGNVSIKKEGDDIIMDFIDKFKNRSTELDKFKILTSDYLANGGDKMNFFLDPLNTEAIGIKLRDAIIQYCIAENKKGNQLRSNLNGRISYE